MIHSNKDRFASGVVVTCIACVAIGLALLTGCPPPVAIDAGVDDAGNSDAGQSEDCPVAETGPSGGTCALEDRVGGFIVDDQDDFSVVSGIIYDAVLPQAVSIPRESAGGCTLFERPLLFCDPPCLAGETCDGTQCIAFPAALDRGHVTISGLDTCVQMDPFPPGFNYFFNGLGRPGMEPGDSVHLVASDFEFHAEGVESIVVDGADWILSAGLGLDVTWTAGTRTSPEVVLSISIDQHGTSPLRLECIVPDTGSATVDASIIDALINAGVSGFPSGKISRRIADRVDEANGCIDFVVSSTRVKRVSVAGFTPCDDVDDCGPGQQCDLANEICIDE